MYQYVGKILLYFWSAVLIIFALKFVIGYFDTMIDFSKTTVDKVAVVIKENIDEYNIMKLPLQKRYGMYINDVISCENELKSTYKTRLLDPAINRIGSSCIKEKCKLSVEFKNEIPEIVELAVKENTDGYCVLKRYKVGSNYQVLGYFVELEITEDLKEKLGIDTDKSEIRLKNAIEYHASTVSGVKKLIFDYKEKLEGDTILVDGKEKFILRFY